MQLSPARPFHFQPTLKIKGSSHKKQENELTRKVFGFEQTYMYVILVTGPLCTSECAGKCHFSANLCKRTLDVTAIAIVEAARNVDILTINAKAL